MNKQYVDFSLVLMKEERVELQTLECKVVYFFEEIV